MGPSAQIMDTHAVLIFSLLLFLLASGEAKVSSCYTCADAEDSACKKGSTSLEKMTCVPGLDEGCMAMTYGALGEEVWTRSCCGGNTEPLTCKTKHTKTGVMNGVMKTDRVSCSKDDCNTMDPRSGSDLHNPALLMVSISALFSMWNIRNK